MTAPHTPAPAARIPPAVREFAELGCPCQWGMPRCENGDHHQCRNARPIVYPAGWVTWSDGHVCTPAPSSDVQVWRVGRPCALRCFCDCHERPTPAVPAVQLDLFDLKKGTSA